MAKQDMTNDLLGVVVAVSKSTEVREVLGLTLDKHMERIKRERGETSVILPETESDLQSFTLLRDAIGNGLRGLVVREVGISENADDRLRTARVSYARSEDINPFDASRLKLKEHDGTSRASVSQIEFNAGMLMPGSPVHRSTMFGTTQKAESSSLQEGVQIGFRSQDVTFNEMTRKPQVRSRVGVSAHITDAGTITGKATNSPNTYDLTHTHIEQGKKIQRAVKGILLGR